MWYLLMRVVLSDWVVGPCISIKLLREGAIFLDWLRFVSAIRFLILDASQVHVLGKVELLLLVCLLQNFAMLGDLWVANAVQVVELCSLGSEANGFSHRARGS